MNLRSEQKRFIDAEGSRLLIGPRPSGKTTCLREIAAAADDYRVTAPTRSQAFDQTKYTKSGSVRGIPIDTVFCEEVFYLQNERLEEAHRTADTVIAAGTPVNMNSLTRVLSFFDDVYVLTHSMYDGDMELSTTLFRENNTAYIFSNKWYKVAGGELRDTGTSNVIKAAAIGRFLPE